MDPQAELFLTQLESIETLNNRSGNFHPDEGLVTSQDHDGNTLLHIVSQRGMATAIEFLLQHKAWKALVNRKNRHGEYKGQCEAVGLTYDVTGHNSEAPLHILCLNCKEDGENATKRILRTLLENGADINLVDGNGWTVLHWSIARKYQFLVDEILATKKVNVNQPTSSQGATPLHMAANRNLFKVVKSLLKRKADRTLVTHSGESILQWALCTARESEASEGDGASGNDDQAVDYGENNEHAANDKSAPGQNPVEDQDDNVDSMDEKKSIDMIIEELLRGRNRWHQLLQLAYSESDPSLLRFACRKLYPDSLSKWRGLHRIWMAMREDRFDDLKPMLVRDMEQARNIPATTVSDCRSWNVLEISSYLGIRQLVTWLLRSKRWTQAEKRNAMSHFNRDTGETDASLWHQPFIKYNGTGKQKYPHPIRNNANDLSNQFEATVVDIFSDGNRFSFSCNSTQVQQLLYSSKSPQRLKPAREEMAEDLCNTVPGLDKSIYDNSSSRFRWIHLPANCMQWMMDATIGAYREEGKKPEDFANRIQFLENSWHELPEIESDQKYMHPSCSRRSSSHSESKQDAFGGDMKTSQLAIYVPYIKCAPRPQPKPQLKRHRDIVFDIYKDDEDLPCEDFKLPFHQSRTLDTYYRGKSEEATARDNDQVFSRYVTRERTSKNITTEPSDQEILHVGQLWLWVADDETIITATSHHPQAGADSIFEAILNRMSNTDEGLNREAVLASMNSFVEFIFSFYINIVDNLALNIDLSGGSGGDPPQEFERVSVDAMFSSSIEEVSRTESILRSKFKQHISPKSDKPSSFESQDIYEAISELTGALTEIKDIRGELKMIRSVVRTQQRVWNQLLSQPMGHDQDDDNKKFNSWKSTDPKYVLDKIESLLEFAEETEKNVTSVLELHMNQLSIHEAETSRIQGETLMVFTIVTVIFTPLSFATSLFALNISAFPHSGDNVSYQPGWIFGILVGILVGFSLIVLVAVKISKPHMLRRLSNPAKLFRTAVSPIRQPGRPDIVSRQERIHEEQDSNQQPNVEVRARWYNIWAGDGPFFQWLWDQLRGKKDITKREGASVSQGLV
ncbi:hypothetical protein F4803DRAFT_551888 [Xylaria telfairii]|nr:hypothetical protein F4803DRAFT_551888 [Xylaria telfairii]